MSDLQEILYKYSSSAKKPSLASSRNKNEHEHEHEHERPAQSLFLESGNVAITMADGW